MALIPTMPKTKDRRVFKEEKFPPYPEYSESDNDWVESNLDAVRWLADNHREIRKVLGR